MLRSANKPLRKEIKILKIEKKRIMQSGETLLSKINKVRHVKQYMKKYTLLDLINVRGVDEDLRLNVIDYIENILNPVNRIDNICSEIYREIEGNEKINLSIEPEATGIEKDFFYKKEIPFIQ